MRRAHAGQACQPPTHYWASLFPPARCKAQDYPLTFFIAMPRPIGTKNKTRIEMTLSSWYGDKIKELRVDSGFESDQAFSAWLLRNTVQILCGQREPMNNKLGDLRLRMEQALPNPENAE